MKSFIKYFIKNKLRKNLRFYKRNGQHNVIFKVATKVLIKKNTLYKRTSIKKVFNYKADVRQKIFFKSKMKYKQLNRCIKIQMKPVSPNGLG